MQDGRLIYIGAAEESATSPASRSRNMFLNGAGGECVRLRNNAHDNAITDSVIQYCGMFGKGDDDDRAEYHNGEGVYIGTSPNSDDQPMHDNDTSSNNVVARNIIRTFGSECFNVKENAHDNVFEDNVCIGNAESARVRRQQHRAARLRQRRPQQRRSPTAPATASRSRPTSDEYDKGGNVVENNRLSGCGGRDLQDQVGRGAGPLLRQRHRGSRAMFNGNGETLGGHRPLLSLGPQRRARRRALRRAVAHVDGPAHLLCRL